MGHTSVRTELVEYLKGRLPGDYHVADRPDHPHLFAAPDLLVGARGRLTALFWPSSRDSRQYHDLLARLTASRLALPSRTVHVLLLPRDGGEPSSQILWNFDHVASIDQLREVERIIRGVRNSSILESLWGVRQRAHSRFSLLSRFVQARQRQRPHGRNPVEVLRGWKSESWLIDSHAVVRPTQIPKRGLRKPRAVIEEEPMALAARSLKGTEGSILQGTRSLCVYSLLSEFNLDRGVPYPADLTPNILLTDELPSVTLGLGKPLWALAFAGWAAIAVDTSDELERLREYLVDLAHRRKIL